MAINIKRIHRDLGSPELDIRMLALNTVLRLSKDNVEGTQDLFAVRERLDQLTHDDDVDISFLARKGLGHLGDLLVKMGLERRSEPGSPGAVLSVEDLRERLQNETSVSRLAAFLALARDRKAPELLTVILRHLEHADPRVRATAVEAIGTCAPRQAVAPIVLTRLGDRHNRVRANVARQLLDLGHDAVVESVKVMLHSPKVAMRESAVYALASLKGSEHAPLLIPALCDSFTPIRIRAIRGLAAHRDARALPHLERLQADVDIDVVEEATRAIRVIRGEIPGDPDAFLDLESLARDASVGSTEDDGLDEREAQRRQAQKEIEAIEAILQKGDLGLRPVDLVGRSPGEVQQILDSELESLGRLGIERCRSGEITRQDATHHYYDFLKYEDLLDKRRVRLEEGGSTSGIFSLVKSKLGLTDDDDPVKRLEQRMTRSLIGLGGVMVSLVNEGVLDPPEIVVRARRILAIEMHQKRRSPGS